MRLEEKLRGVMLTRFYDDHLGNCCSGGQQTGELMYAPKLSNIARCSGRQMRTEFITYTSSFCKRIFTLLPSPHDVPERGLDLFSVSTMFTNQCGHNARFLFFLESVY